MNLYKDAEHCSGCGACFQACPQKAISLKPNEFGFIFPSIDNVKCVECGACQNVCPYNNLDKLKSERLTPAVLALRHNSGDIVNKSSSGGAFSAIIDAVCPDYVFGAAWNGFTEVNHIGIPITDDLQPIRKSKYIQSNTKDTFNETRKLLNSGKRVLYSGTPCQIAGLRSFLKKDYENLFTVDLICEGVQSQHFWNQYVDYMQRKYQSKITNVEFRNKQWHGWERSDFSLNFANGKTYHRISHTKDSAYMNSFIFQGGNRDSCYACPYADIPRQGDFTIGDLWGWRDIVPKWNDNRGASVVLCNSRKAINLIETFSTFAEIKTISLESATAFNPNILKHTIMPPQRSRYISDLKDLPFDELESKWLKPRSFFRRVLSQLKFLLKHRNK